jgi:hypothetical protein
MPAAEGTKMGEFKELRVDPKFLKNHQLVLASDKPSGEDGLNW